MIYRQNVDFPLFSPPQITMDGVPSAQLKQHELTRINRQIHIKLTQPFSDHHPHLSCSNILLQNFILVIVRFKLIISIFILLQYCQTQLFQFLRSFTAIISVSVLFCINNHFSYSFSTCVLQRLILSMSPNVTTQYSTVQ